MKLRRGAAAITAAVIASYCVISAGQGVNAGSVAPATTATHRTTVLPATQPYSLVVDDAHDQVFISLGPSDAVVVTDLDGTVKQTLTGLSKPTNLAISDDGAAVYVAEYQTSTIARIDTETLAVTRITVPEGICPRSVAFTGGKLWFSHRPVTPCGATGGSPGLGSFDPATGEVVVAAITLPRAVTLRALPDRPDRLVAIDRADYLGIYDLTAEQPALVAEKVGGGWAARCEDAALTSGGDQVVVACWSPSRHQVFNTADLSAAPSLHSSPYPNAVALSPDSGRLAAGVMNGAGCDVFLRDVSGGTPGVAVGGYDLGANLELLPHTVGLSATGRLYGVSKRDSETSLLHVFAGPATCPTELRLTSVTRSVKFGHSVVGRGQLGHTLETPGAVSVTRVDRSGSHPVGSFTVWSDGAFMFVDFPDLSGEATYTVRYEGDAAYGPASVSTTVKVRPLPYDVNGDGNAEVVTGAPGEDLGSVKSAGMFHLLYGTSGGVTTAKSLAIHQNTSGVPGAAESGDGFGRSNTAGDFNGDGYADVAVSAGRENLGDTTDAGGVWIFYGSANGLRTDNVQTVTLDHTHREGTKYARFGDALASGDFNADGAEDLAIGAPGVGDVFIAMGSDSGLSRASLVHIDEDTENVPGVKRPGERFGWSLAAGDIDSDRNDDLAIGAPYDSDDRGYATGAVTLIYGGEQGLRYRPQRFTKDTDGVPGTASSFGSDKPDRFGYQVVLDRFDQHGGDDLAVGAPGSPVTYDGVRKADAGTVTVLYTYDGRISTFRAVEVTQATGGMPGKPGQRDELGTTLAAGDPGGDLISDLAIYSPGDTYVSVVPGSGSGLAYHDAKGITQNSFIWSSPTESGDRWGGSLRFADVAGYGYEYLLVGADGENSGAGALTVIDSWRGLSRYGEVYDQNYEGIPGTAEAGDGFGSFL